jgi:hypothetical protein
VGTSWPWSYGSWVYNYLWNWCLSPLMLWVRIPLRARCTTLCDNVCQWLAAGRWFSPGTPVSSTNKTDLHDIAEILLKVALTTIKPKYKLVLCWRMLYLIVILLYIINNLLLQIVQQRCQYNGTNSVSMNESINKESVHLTKNKCFLYDKQSTWARRGATRCFKRHQWMVDNKGELLVDINYQSK